MIDIPDTAYVYFKYNKMCDNIFIKDHYYINNDYVHVDIEWYPPIALHLYIPIILLPETNKGIHVYEFSQNVDLSSGIIGNYLGFEQTDEFNFNPAKYDRKLKLKEILK